MLVHYKQVYLHMTQLIYILYGPWFVHSFDRDSANSVSVIQHCTPFFCNPILRAKIWSMLHDSSDVW